MSHLEFDMKYIVLLYKQLLASTIVFFIRTRKYSILSICRRVPTSINYFDVLFLNSQTHYSVNMAGSTLTLAQRPDTCFEAVSPVRATTFVSLVLT